MENFNSLVEEFDYQTKFSYEKRVDLFNKYSISTSQKFFNPIFELAAFIINPRILYDSQFDKTEPKYCPNIPKCYSHSGAVATSFNSDVKENKSNHVKIHKNGVYLYRYYRDKEEYRSYFTFNNESKTFTIKNVDFFNDASIRIERDIYSKIDEWLIDFGYEKW